MVKSLKWSRENIAWASGIFEGEGCFRINKNKDRPTFCMIMSMTDEDVINKFYDIVGVGSVSGPIPGKKEGYKEFWQWRCQKFEDVQALSAAMFPFLLSRRQSKIIECLSIIKEYKKTVRPRGNDIICGYGHPRSEFGRKSKRNYWICSICETRWSSTRKEKSSGPDKRRRLTLGQELEINDLLLSGEMHKDIAMRYNVARSTITNIARKMKK